MVSLSEMVGLEASEGLRVKLLKSEFRLRKKQPEAWTKTKYRPYANFRTKKKTEEEIAAAATKKVQRIEIVEN
ncbi:Uncharacterised protein [uncultured archaeon]|nr:Uncharacterised protein [uncultured archaeon]